jgi:6-phospho-beta-glucosidase
MVATISPADAPGRHDGKVAFESSVHFSNGTARTIVPEHLSPKARTLIEQVADYEAAVLEAITGRSIGGLVEAMDIHPLTPSRQRNRIFVTETVSAWPDVFSTWSRD